MEAGLISSILGIANKILTSAILLTGFSLVVYILRHNARSAVGRAFCVLVAFVMIAYLGDLIILQSESAEWTLVWLKLQWVGIAFVPAAYLHFSDALLNTTGSVSRLRHNVVRLSYLGGAATLLLVILTPWVVWDGIDAPFPPRLQAGPLFEVFAVYFFAVIINGAINVNRARKRCLTSTSRRRMGYLTLSFAAPAMGAFPFMLISTLPTLFPTAMLLLILLIGNVGVALMLVMMAYTVAYFGAFNPDRVIKYNLIEYLLRGPLLASLVVVIFVTLPQIEMLLGMSGDLITLFVAALTIILGQMGINLARPFLNRLVYRQDVGEVAWLQALDTRLLTPSDLEQFLENILSSIAELLRVRQAFVVTLRQDRFRIEAHCGSDRVARSFLERYNPRSAFDTLPILPRQRLFQEIDGHLLLPLYDHHRDAISGLLVIERWAAAPQVDESVWSLIEQAETALEDRRLQEGIFAALQEMMPDIAKIQEQHHLMRYVTSPPPLAADSPIDNPGLTRWVKDALTHYWGGPNLTHSPLLKLRAVGARVEAYQGDSVRALRDVLQQAIDALRPAGERSMTSSEWTLYNILDLKFREGWRVNDIANRLAISESDLYRKQRAAIAEVSRTLETIERQSKSQAPQRSAG